MQKEYKSIVNMFLVFIEIKLIIYHIHHKTDGNFSKKSNVYGVTWKRVIDCTITSVASSNYFHTTSALIQISQIYSFIVSYNSICPNFLATHVYCITNILSK